MKTIKASNSPTAQLIHRKTSWKQNKQQHHLWREPARGRLPTPTHPHHVGLQYVGWSHIKDSQKYDTNLRDFSTTAFSTTIIIRYFQKNEMSENTIFPKGFVFLELCEYLCVSKDKYYWFWESWSRPLAPKTMKMKSFPNMNPERYWSKMNQNNSTELLGCSFLKM